MKIICKRTGKPVRSRGLVQISECWHPEVLDKEAFDPEFSISFLTKALKEGKCSEWTTCRKYK